MDLIRPLTEELKQDVAKLQLSPEQAVYVGGGAQACVERTSSRLTGHVIFDADNPAGFFILDLRYPKDYQFADASSIGLRSFFVAENFQGRGLAKKVVASLPEYVRQLGIGAQRIYLTVNCKNVVARSVYQKSGFIDSGDLYLGGPKGPQHIMQMPVA